MSIPGRLEVASTGHVTGPASITYALRYGIFTTRSLWRNLIIPG